MDRDIRHLDMCLLSKLSPWTDSYYDVIDFGNTKQLSPPSTCHYHCARRGWECQGWDREYVHARRRTVVLCCQCHTDECPLLALSLSHCSWFDVYERLYSAFVKDSAKLLTSMTFNKALSSIRQLWGMAKRTRRHVCLVSKCTLSTLHNSHLLRSRSLRLLSPSHLVLSRLSVRHFVALSKSLVSVEEGFVLRI